MKDKKAARIQIRIDPRLKAAFSTAADDADQVLSTWLVNLGRKEIRRLQGVGDPSANPQNVATSPAHAPAADLPLPSLVQSKIARDAIDTALAKQAQIDKNRVKHEDGTENVLDPTINELW